MRKEKLLFLNNFVMTTSCQLKLIFYCLICRLVEFKVNNYKLWYITKIILKLKFRVQRYVTDVTQKLSVTLRWLSESKYGPDVSKNYFMYLRGTRHHTCEIIYPATESNLC